MPIIISNELPIKKKLETENIFVMNQSKAFAQDIRALKIIILNLMPEKQNTELDLCRLLSNTPLQLEITFLRMRNHNFKNESMNHLEKFYKTFQEIKDDKFDGMIITGAPVEKLSFEQVDYWDELKEVFEWKNKNVTSTIHICWASQAALYYYYNINKHITKEKIFGIYNHTVKIKKDPLVRGFDDTFYAPHSRYTNIDKMDIIRHKDLRIIASSDICGPTIMASKDNKNIFISCHLEYDRMRLDAEFKRDLDKKIEINIPNHYYPNNDISQLPILSWRMASQLLFSNWINYYVYQITPFNLDLC